MKLYIYFLITVFVGYPVLAILFQCFVDKGSQEIPQLKGLNLPEGSIRAMIAIAIIGSYLITLALALFGKDGLEQLDKERLSLILASFSSLSGAVVGFYFASRGKDK